MDHHSQAIKIHVSGLQLGMYVSQLDKDWLDSPFLYQGFIIETMEDIDLLEKECEHVWIDPAKEQNDKREPNRLLKKPSNNTRHYVNKLSMPKELKNTSTVFQTSRQRTKTIMDEVAINGVIDTKAAKETVETCLDSILRNPDAMLWLSKIRDANTYTAEHSLNVCILALAFGRHLGIDEDELFQLGMCGLLHDVGKMRIPPEVINKTEPLTPKEWKQMQAHALLGRNLLMQTPGIGHSVDVAYSHHERIDGQGYPRGIDGSKLSKHTRIISLADSFDAMTAKRCYSSAMTPTAAVKEIYKSRGKQFDEHLAVAFIKVIGLYPPGTIVELTNNYLCIVLERSTRYQHLPTVLLIKNEKGNKVKKRILDLSDIERGKMPKTFLIKTEHCDGHEGIFIADYKDFVSTLE